MSRSYRDRVISLYQKYAPEKIATVDKTMKASVGREEALIEALVSKYGPEPDEKAREILLEISNIKTKCVVLMTTFAPDKVGGIQKALDGPYKGREADLLRDLTLKYDPPLDDDPLPNTGQHEILHNLMPFRYRMRQLFFPASHKIALIENARIVLGLPITLTDKESQKLPFEWFEAFVMVIIFSNTLQLALEDPETESQGMYLLLERLFMMTFIGEAMIRMLCFGLFQERGPLEHGTLMPPAYFRDWWNVFDFVIIVCGGIDFMATSINIEGLSALRTVRALRPLKSVSKFPSVRLLVNAILVSLPKLRDVSFLLLLFFASFGVVGLQQFMGGFRKRCVDEVWFENQTADPRAFLCPFEKCGLDIVICKNYTQKEKPQINQPAYYCPWGYACIDVENPGYNMIGFDNIFQSCLALASIVSLDAWSPTMYFAVQSTNVYASGYFVIVVIIGAFFIINLTVVVITISIEENKRSEDKAAKSIEYTSLFEVIATMLQPLKKYFEPTMKKLMAPFDKFEEYCKSSQRIQDTSTYFNEKILKQAWFSFVIGVAIASNVIIFSMDHYSATGPIRWIELLLFVSNLFFTVIFTIELIINVIAHPKEYFQEGFNVFDTMIVVGSWIDVISSSKTGNLAGFRVARVALRVLKFAHLFPSLSRWIRIIVLSIPSTGVVLILLFMLMFVFSCFCKDLLGASYHSQGGGVPRMNFHDISASMLTAFQIITGEDWSEIIYNAMNSRGKVMAIPIILFFYISKYLMLNLFVAVLLSTRDDIDEEDNQKIQYALLPPPPPNRPLLHDEYNRAPPSFTLDSEPETIYASIVRHTQQAVVHPYFEIMVTVAIVGSSICMTLDTPSRPPDSLTSQLINKMDLVATSVFVIEVLAKAIGYTFLGYIRASWWNKFDFIVVLTALVGIFLDRIIGFRFMKYVKCLRALRPLRFVHRVKGLNIVFKALVASVPGLLNILVMSVLLWFVWGITGVQLFKGKFYSCSGNPDTLLNISICENTTDAAGRKYKWVNAPNHFDNILQALISLFVMGTLEGWVPMMHRGMDAYTHEEVRTNYTYWNCLYFVCFIVIGCFYLVNLFVGVLIDTYDAEKKKTNKSAFITTEQKAWIDTHHRLFKAIPQVPGRNLAINAEKAFLVDVVESSGFQNFIFSVIAVNIVVMMMDSYPTPSYSKGLETLDTLCAFIFMFEIVIRMGAYGAGEFFQKNWNRWDFFLVLLSVPGIVASYVFGTSTRFTSVFRIMRIMRIIRVMKAATSIHNLMRTFITTIPSLSNISGVLFLVYFVFAVIAVAIFGGLKRQHFINRNANFESFGLSMLTLFRMTTGESWHEIMSDCAVQPPECDLNLGECGYRTGKLFFICFMMLGMHILLNLFIAVMMDSFDHGSHTVVDVALTNEEIAVFFKVWKKYDLDCKYKIPLSSVTKFFDEMSPLCSLGYPSHMAFPADRMKWVSDLKVLAYDEEVYLVDLMSAMVLRQCATNLPDKQIKRLVIRAERFRNMYSSGQRDGLPQSNCGIAYAALMVQQWWRRHKRSKPVETIEGNIVKETRGDRRRMMRALQKHKDEFLAQHKRGMRVYAARPNKRGGSYRERVISLYQKYAPEKIATVDDVMRQSAGKEEFLIEALVSKYGAEPYYDHSSSPRPVVTSPGASVFTSRPVVASIGRPSWAAELYLGQAQSPPRGSRNPFREKEDFFDEGPSSWQEMQRPFLARKRIDLRDI